MKILKSESGSILALLAGVVGFCLLLTILMSNVQQAAVAESRAHDLATSSAIAAAQDSDEFARSFFELATANSKNLATLQLDHIDAKTVRAKVCIDQELAIELFDVSRTLVCAEAMSRNIRS
jgi:hypothetical protein